MKEMLVIVCLAVLGCGLAVIARHIGDNAAAIENSEREQRESELKEWAEKEKMDRENAAANAK